MTEDEPEVFEFEGTIEAAPRGGAWIRFPFDPAEAFGTRRSVRVIAHYDDYRAESNVVSMGGGPVLGVHKGTRQAIGKDVGDTVRVRLCADTRPRTIAIPAELKEAFEASPAVRTRYQDLSFTHRKEFAEWVGGAKKPETRVRRAQKAVDMILTGIKP